MAVGPEKVLNVKIPWPVYQRLKAQADKTGESMARIVSQALEQYLDE